jgi:hypothetical protein
MLRAALLAAALTSLLAVDLRPLAAQQPMPAEEVEVGGAIDPQAAPCPVGAGQMVGPQGGVAAGVPTGPPLKLFYNYYVGPPGVPAQLYPMPRPTPAYVGQVWITYPPLMPHEFLYHHHRRYYRYTPGGYSSASVRYSSGIMGFLPSF